MHCHCGTNNRAPRWTFTYPCKPEVRPGAREGSASPAWLAAPAMNARDTTKVYMWRLDTGWGPTLYRKCHSHNTPGKRQKELGKPSAIANLWNRNIPRLGLLFPWCFRLSIPPGQSVKTCMANGTWVQRTDYTICLNYDVSNQYICRWQLNFAYKTSSDCMKKLLQHLFSNQFYTPIAYCQYDIFTCVPGQEDKNKRTNQI